MYHPCIIPARQYCVLFVWKVRKAEEDLLEHGAQSRSVIGPYGLVRDRRNRRSAKLWLLRS